MEICYEAHFEYRPEHSDKPEYVDELCKEGPVNVGRVKNAITDYLTGTRKATELDKKGDPYLRIYHIIGEDTTVLLRTVRDSFKTKRVVPTEIRVEIRSGNSVDDVVNDIMEVAPELKRTS
tara:strand:- start:938 stop:1300 length:363 start_codon:yes stop_codon:yes gene_type:complete